MMDPIIIYGIANTVQAPRKSFARIANELLVGNTVIVKLIPIKTVKKHLADKPFVLGVGDVF
jgi:hypothetical protein